MEKFIRIILFIIGLLLSIYGISLMINIRISFGYILPALIGAFLIAFSFFLGNKFSKFGVGRIFKIIVYAGLGFFIVTFVIFFVTIKINAQRVPPKNADAVIVLGAGLYRGNQVSLTLASRLLKAKEYFESNRDSIIVVSGGQGEDELMSEALAMKKYLVAKGVPEESIVIEDKSTTTLENFKFSKNILDKMFGEEYEVIYVSNDFHIIRAGFFAKSVGLNASGLACKTYSAMILTYYLREYCAVLWYLVMGV